jgi:hypothetical protein
MAAATPAMKIQPQVMQDRRGMRILGEVTSAMFNRLMQIREI